jgi:D-xylulose reductase
VVHPAAFTFKLPDSIRFDEGAMVEPLAIGLHAATIVGIRPGDRAMVCGAGTIGLMAAIAARAGACGRVFITDLAGHKLKTAARIPGVIPIDASSGDPIEKVLAATEGRGCELLFEATGSPEVTRTMTSYLAPGGRIVAIGISPDGIIPIDIVAAKAKELEIRTIFRYAGIYPRAIELMASGSINVAPFITHRYPMDKAVEAFDFVKSSPPGLVKCVLDLA